MIDSYMVSMIFIILIKQYYDIYIMKALSYAVDNYKTESHHHACYANAYTL